jgi:phosphopantothenoylcysteine decarboxylase/phosphopantothenate--cysteine ligase
MAEPVAIVAAALAELEPQSMSGKRVLISVGGTREPIDPVRYLGNRSTGHMGLALATIAQRRGAEVTVVHGALEVSLPPATHSVSVATAEQMREAMLAASANSDIVIMAAAVADWRVEEPSPTKIKKTEEESLTLTLTKTPDILRELAEKKPSGQILVGFAAETVADDQALIELAEDKLRAKGCDVIVANRVGDQIGFGETDTAVAIVQRSGAPVLSTGSKLTVAGRLLDVLPNL